MRYWMGRAMRAVLVGAIAFDAYLSYQIAKGKPREQAGR